MDSRKPSVDLGKELTCSICTELLYQPLTLLDCLHTYCGACLKEWFRFQAATAERAPTPPTPDTPIFTCPSCRSRVRDTRHNATVVTLLDMFTAANPGRDRSDDEKAEMQAKYKPGDQVLPKVAVRERTAEERRAEEEDRRLIDEVRERSLREAVANSTSRGHHRRRGESRSGDERPHSSREHRSSSNAGRNREGGHSQHAEHNGGNGVDLLSPDGHRRRRSESRQRQVEHQSSLRSLIGSQMSERDIQREIDEFARQIQEEGLLDGLDLDNIDLSRDDELSRRITEAYRRRQRERSRHEPARRSNASARSGVSRHTDTSQSERLRSHSRPQSRPRTHSRSTSGVEPSEDRSRPPLSASANLEVRDPERRTRRRTASGGRSSTTPIPTTNTETSRVAARSQTDLTIRPQTSDPTSATSPPIAHMRPGRSSSLDAVPTTQSPVELPAISSRTNASFATRAPGTNPINGPAPAPPPVTIVPEPIELPAAAPPPRNSRPQHRASESNHGNANASLLPSPLIVSTSRHQRSNTQLYEEPSLTCSRCRKPHIEYDVHYNCQVCSDGHWNLCLDCYRAGKGCLHWFGFGHGSWRKWVKKKQGDSALPPPHRLEPSRYLRPSSTTVDGESRKILSHEDPKSRLESGAFCAGCLTWTNDCYWQCDSCNEGEWGYCNDCVNQGRSCSHKLLPLAHEVATAPHPRSRSPGRPPAATMLMGPQTAGVGPFKPLSFNTRCDLCKETISPFQTRYHCFNCKSTLVPDASPGDYDICPSCYEKLESEKRISTENGQGGWRRCLNGHRMVVVGFAHGKVGQWRYIERDLVGGRALRHDPVADDEDGCLQKWSWREGGKELEHKRERLVAKDVSDAGPTPLAASSYASHFPPNGGTGMKAHAMWAWYPKPGADDELMFPRGADIHEVKDVNEEWSFGSYMGSKGLFPAQYVRIEKHS